MHNSYTTPKELFSIARRLRAPLAWVGFKDQIPASRIQPGQGYILNLQSSDEEGNGTHWTCFYISKDGRKAAYFDSFGSELPVEVEKALKHLKIYKSSKIIQNIDSGYCGQYCLVFLFFIRKHDLAGVRLDRAIQSFENLWSDNPENNLKILRAALKRTCRSGLELIDCISLLLLVPCSFIRKYLLVSDFILPKKLSHVIVDIQTHRRLFSAIIDQGN